MNEVNRQMESKGPYQNMKRPERSGRFEFWQIGIQASPEHKN